jgi:mycofactocin precursor
MGGRTTVSEPAADTIPAPVTEPDPLAADELLADELLVEEVTIDGLCGVY